MKRIIPIFMLAASLSASAQEINDQNTPLHLMQPNYSTPYGVPKVAEVKSSIDKVLAYLEKAMPAKVEDERLAKGSFRLTSYEAGVLYSAMLSASEATGDQRYAQFTKERLSLIAEQAKKEAKALEKDRQYDTQMRMVLYPGALDDCGAMASAYCRMMTGASVDKKAKKDIDDVINRYVSFVSKGQYRLQDGTFARHRPHRNTVWLDDMYMGVPSLAWYGRYTNDAAYINEAISQIALFKEKMAVPMKSVNGEYGCTEKSGALLFRHGWVESMNPHPAYYWGRANGWAILTMCEVLDAMETMPCAKEDREMVLTTLQQHIAALAALQDKTGFWHQLLDRQDTYLETSCTAIYTYCIAHAIIKGWIDPLAYGATAFLGWQACKTKINAQGQVEGTCVGTGMGFEPAFYAYRPVHKMAAHGYGPMIWAGSEIIKMLSATHPKMNDSALHFYPTEQKTDQPIFYENFTEEEVLW